MIILKLLNKMENVDYVKWIGQVVYKPPNKPFKSGNKTEVVIGISINPHSNKIGFRFSDDTIVDCHQCKLLPRVIKVKKGDLVTLYNGVNGYISDLFTNYTIEITSGALSCGIYHIQNLKTVNGIPTENSDLDYE